MINKKKAQIVTNKDKTKFKTISCPAYLEKREKFPSPMHFDIKEMLPVAIPIAIAIIKNLQDQQVKALTKAWLQVYQHKTYQ